MHRRYQVRLMVDTVEAIRHTDAYGVLEHITGKDVAITMAITT